MFDILGCCIAFVVHYQWLRYDFHPGIKHIINAVSQQFILICWWNGSKMKSGEMFNQLNVDRLAATTNLTLSYSLINSKLTKT